MAGREGPADAAAAPPASSPASAPASASAPHPSALPASPASSSPQGSPRTFHPSKQGHQGAGSGGPAPTFLSPTPIRPVPKPAATPIALAPPSATGVLEGPLVSPKRQGEAPLVSPKRQQQSQGAESTPPEAAPGSKKPTTPGRKSETSIKRPPKPPASSVNNSLPLEQAMKRSHSGTLPVDKLQTSQRPQEEPVAAPGGVPPESPTSPSSARGEAPLPTLPDPATLLEHFSPKPLLKPSSSLGSLSDRVPAGATKSLEVLPASSLQEPSEGPGGELRDPISPSHSGEISPVVLDMAASSVPTVRPPHERHARERSRSNPNATIPPELTASFTRHPQLRAAEVSASTSAHVPSSGGRGKPSVPLEDADGLVPSSRRRLSMNDVGKPLPSGPSSGPIPRAHMPSARPSLSRSSSGAGSPTPPTVARRQGASGLRSPSLSTQSSRHSSRSLEHSLDELWGREAEFAAHAQEDARIPFRFIAVNAGAATGSPSKEGHGGSTEAGATGAPTLAPGSASGDRRKDRNSIMTSTSEAGNNPRAAIDPILAGEPSWMLVAQTGDMREDVFQTWRESMEKRAKKYALDPRRSFH